MISIIMGLYNAEKTIEEAISSIQKQTYTDWELIICDDGSTDSSVSIVSKMSLYDERIKLIKNDVNMGLNYTLNQCLKYANGEYIARMDADDISFPNRFERELSVIKETNMDIVSSSMIYFDENGEWGKCKLKQFPQKEDFIKGSPFCHAPCLVKKSAYLAVQGYSVDAKLLRVEDYHLWYKMYKNGYKGTNILEPLYKMRDDRNATNRRKFKYRLNESYVKYLIWRDFDYPVISFIYIFRPILVGLMPRLLYEKLHRKKIKNSRL